MRLPHRGVLRRSVVARAQLKSSNSSHNISSHLRYLSQGDRSQVEINKLWDFYFPGFCIMVRTLIGPDQFFASASRDGPARVCNQLCFV